MDYFKCNKCGAMRTIVLQGGPPVLGTIHARKLRLGPDETLPLPGEIDDGLDPCGGTWEPYTPSDLERRFQEACANTGFQKIKRVPMDKPLPSSNILNAPLVYFSRIAADTAPARELIQQDVRSWFLANNIHPREVDIKYRGGEWILSYTVTGSRKIETLLIVDTAKGLNYIPIPR